VSRGLFALPSSLPLAWVCSFSAKPTHHHTSAANRPPHQINLLRCNEPTPHHATNYAHRTAILPNFIQSLRTLSHMNDNAWRTMKSLASGERFIYALLSDIMIDVMCSTTGARLAQLQLYYIQGSSCMPTCVWVGSPRIGSFPGSGPALQGRTPHRIS